MEGWDGMGRDEGGTGEGYSEDKDLSPRDDKRIRHILIYDMDFPIHALHPRDRRQSVDNALTHPCQGMILRQYLALEHLHRLFIDLSSVLSPSTKTKAGSTKNGSNSISRFLGGL